MPTDSIYLLFNSKSLIAIALEVLEAEGHQAPPPQQLAMIIDSGRRSSHLLAAASVQPPSEGDIQEFFTDFVVRCINRPAGVGDAASD